MFYSRAEFEGHIARDCDKVSKGKQEKWDILYHAFTPYVTDVMSSGLVDGTQSANTTISQLHHHVRSQSNIGPGLGRMCAPSDDAPHNPSSPTTVELGFTERREPESPRPTEVQQLRAALSYLLLPLLEDKNDTPDAEKLRHLRECKERATVIQGVFNHQLQEDDQQILRGLKLQHNELPQGLMDEINSQQDVINSQQPLSRTSSGLSSGRITHVPTSPPQQAEEFVGAGHGHLPPSNADSGYGSANRISLTESEAARLRVAHPGYNHLAPQQQAGNKLEVGRPDVQYQQPAPQQRQQGTGDPLMEGSLDPPSPSTVFEGLDGFQLIDHETGLEIIHQTWPSRSSKE